MDHLSENCDSFRVLLVQIRALIVEYSRKPHTHMIFEKLLILVKEIAGHINSSKIDDIKEALNRTRTVVESIMGVLRSVETVVLINWSEQERIIKQIEMSFDYSWV